MLGKANRYCTLLRFSPTKVRKSAQFKSQNVSSLIFNIENTDNIIARAQAIQAIAARRLPDVRMNPILLKPLGNFESDIYLNGKFYLKMKAQEYYENFVLNQGFENVLKSYKELRKENDIILLEGAGSPAEINILKYDIANMLFAKKIKSKVILVSDIERGGSFASILGTISILKPKYRKLIKGILINKFLGDDQILMPAIYKIEKKIHKPFLGIIPKIDHNIPAEDSLDGKNKDNININITIDSEKLNTEINKIANVIESTIDIKYILHKIME